jgi:hypothetical protein
MGKFLSAFSLVMLCGVLSVRAQGSSLAFSTLEGEPFLLYVNGNQINRNPDNYVVAENLWDGMYWIKVVVNPQTDAIVVERKVPLVGFMNLSFVVRKAKRGKYKITLQGLGNVSNLLGSRRRRGGLFDGMFGDIDILTNPFPERERRNNPNPYEERVENQGKPEGITPSNPSTTERQSLKITDEEFLEIKKRMQEEISDEEKLRIAKFSMKNTGYFSSEQVAELVGIISFEREKLDLAKFGYEYTYDRYQYYTKVAKMLKTDESKKALFDYLETK